jgi:aspartate/methionine/tyrosine aminotransferase
VGSFPRPTTIPIDSASREYGPTAGIKPLRAAVARLYNEQYRQGKESQYTWENVCIVPGGRAGLIRIAAILGNSYLSFPIPDYTAYSEMLSLFKNVRLLLCRVRAWADFDSSLPSPFHWLKTTTTTFTPTRSQKRLLEVPRLS